MGYGHFSSDVLLKNCTRRHSIRYQFFGLVSIYSPLWQQLWHPQLTWSSVALRAAISGGLQCPYSVNAAV